MVDAGRSPRRALATVFAIVVIDLLGFGILIPILPFYVRSFGVSDVSIGLLAASYSVMQFGFAPLLGGISDERGRRPVLILSMGGSAIAWVLFGLGAEFQALFASDPVVVAAEGALPAFVPATRFSLPSFVAAGFSLLAFVATALVLPEPDRVRTAAARRGLVAQFRAALADADLRPLVAVFLVVSIAFSGIQVAFIPFVADQFGYTTSQAGLLLTYIGALGVLNQGVLVPGLSRRTPDSRLAVAGTIFLRAGVARRPRRALGRQQPAEHRRGVDGLPCRRRGRTGQRLRRHAGCGLTRPNHRATRDDRALRRRRRRTVPDRCRALRRRGRAPRVGGPPNDGWRSGRLTPEKRPISRRRTSRCR
jgi:predicted MFS family arabinose efflux permease